MPSCDCTLPNKSKSCPCRRQPKLPLDALLLDWHLPRGISNEHQFYMHVHGLRFRCLCRYQVELVNAGLELYS